MRRYLNIFLLGAAIYAFPFNGLCSPAIGFGKSGQDLPVWYDANGLTNGGEHAIEILTNSGKHGINPSRYQVKLLEKANSKITDAAAIEEINSTITRNLILHLLDLKFGVTKSKQVIAKLTEEEKKSFQDYFLNAMNIIATNNYSIVTDSFANQNAEYLKLQKVLSVYKWAKEGKVLAEVKPGKTIKKDQENAQIMSIRRNMAIIAELNQGLIPREPKLAASNIYDEGLVAAVTNFQKINNLESSGDIGKQTVNKMNKFLDESIDKIEYTMEKIRTDEGKQNNKFILVNIPEYKLYAYSNGNLEFTMPVIVGDKDNPTPEFQNHINNIVVNPDWTPTERITKNELLPKIRSNPEFLAKSGYEVKWVESNELISSEEHSKINWEEVDVSQIRIRQPSGKGNALGNIKFLMPNSNSIYLHDTSSRGLFKNSYRALSHGCIRLGEPMKLAEFVLGTEEYKKYAIEKSIGKSSKYIKVANFPVYVTYKTVWFNENGINFAQDVYGKGHRFKTAVAETIMPELIASISPYNSISDSSKTAKLAIVTKPYATASK